MTQEEAILELKQHADQFLQSGMWSHTGYFPDDSYGNEAKEYYEWSKRAYELIKKLEQ